MQTVKKSSYRRSSSFPRKPEEEADAGQLKEEYNLIDSDLEEIITRLEEYEDEKE